MSLIAAVKDNNINEVKRLIDEGANIDDQIGSKLLTPLIVAADKGYTEIVKLLLDAGADKDKHNKNGDTPLILAANNGYIAIVAQLLDAGADKDKQDNNGGTALIYAANREHTEIVKLLLDAGADIDKQNKNGDTPLILAARYGYTEIVKLLLDAGADKDKPDLNDVTALIYAANNGDTEIVKLLLDVGADKDKHNKKGDTPLILAADKGHTKIVKLLLEAGANTHKIIRNGKSVYEFAQDDTFIPEINELIIDYGSRFAPKWEGFTQSDISRLDTIFQTESPMGRRPDAENYSMCPICLKFVERSEACKYMTHNCSIEGGYYHKKLYKKFKNSEGKIYWCTICNRICSGHRHYKVQPWDTPEPELVPIIVGVNVFSGDCRGAEGGGGLPEKLVRFRRFKEYARELQGEIGKKTMDEAINELVEEMWNAPFARITEARRRNILEKKKFNISTENFTANRATLNTTAAVNLSNVVRSNRNILRPIMKNIGNEFTNNVGLNDVGKVIYFRHKTLDGTLVDHFTRDPKEGIGQRALKDYIKNQNINFGLPEFGQCPFTCGALLYPDEIEGLVEPVDYETYRSKFNNKFTRRVGGTRKTRKLRPMRPMRQMRKTRGGKAVNILVEAKLAQCNIKKGGLNNTRKSK